MSYVLKTYARISHSINDKVFTRKFTDKHQLALFIVNFARGVYVDYNSEDSATSEYVISDGFDDGQHDRSSNCHITSDDQVIDFCLRKYEEKLWLNDQTGNYFNTDGGRLWRGHSPEIEESDYKKAEKALRAYQKNIKESSKAATRKKHTLVHE